MGSKHSKVMKFHSRLLKHSYEVVSFSQFFYPEPHKISTHSVIFIFSIGCLIELKFCEVSRNSFSNRYWKFQLSILKNKKVLFLKKIWFRPLSISKQKSFVYWPNFQRRFWLRPAMNGKRSSSLWLLPCTTYTQHLFHVDCQKISSMPRKLPTQNYWRHRVSPPRSWCPLCAATGPKVVASF